MSPPRKDVEKESEGRAAVLLDKTVKGEQVDAALRASEERFRTIVDGLDDGFLILDVKTGNVVDVNRKMCEMYGLSRKEVLAPDFELWNSGQRPYTQQEAMTWVKRALEGEPQIFEWCNQHKQGHLFWVEVSMRRCVIGGRERLFVGVRDITDRKRAENIRTSLYRISEDANLAQDLDELFRSIHSIVAQLMPAKDLYIALYDAEIDQVSFPYWVNEHDPKPEDQSPGDSLTAYVLKTRQPLLASPQGRDAIVMEEKIEVRGTPPIDWLGVPLTIQDKVIGVLAVQSYTEGIRYGQEDKDVLVFVSTQVARVIERKRAEEERERLLATLGRRSKQLQTAAEVSKSAITSLDPEQLMRRAVRLIQESFGFYYVGIFLVNETGDYAVLQAGTGEAGEEMVTKGYRLPVGGASLIGWCTAHGRACIAFDETEGAIRYDNPLLPRTRSEMALPLMSHRQGCVGALTVQSSEETAFYQEDVAVLQTMTDQLAIAIENARLHSRVQRYAAELEEHVAERTAELAAVNKELEAFAYSVSHDLRAPLRAIDGFSQALLEDCGDSLDAIGQDHLRRVREASQRMGQLIDDLLKLSRVSRGGLRREVVDLSAVAQGIVEELKATQPERQVQFDIATDLVVEGDVRLLRIALENLLGNAWKFTSKKACAKIELSSIQVDGRQVCFVRDDGAGFDSDYADKLFGPFQRLHSRDEFEGTGIGLATVQRIINRHGGRVWAEGAVGEGATFYFSL